MKNAADLRAGETVCVVGAGGVGANCLQIARAFGAEKVCSASLSLLCFMLFTNTTHNNPH